MPYCQECGAEIRRDAKFCPECDAHVLQIQDEPAGVAPSVPSPSASYYKKGSSAPVTQTKKEKHYNPVGVIIIVSVIVIAILALSSSGYVASLLYYSSPSPSPSPNQQASVVYPSYVAVYNWINDQVVQYVAVSLATGQSYQSTYAVAALPGPANHPQSGIMALPLPANGAYKLTVYTATGHTVWWNSVYLNVDNKGSPAKLIIGNSFIAYTSLITGNIANSYFENVQCSGSS